MKNLKERFGSWGIVTGASSGIGKGFAEQLAKKGFNLILIARRENLLNELAKTLTKNHNIEVRCLVLDLSSNDFINILNENVNNLDVGLLISNAGAGLMGAFNTISSNELEKMIRLNVLAQMKLSHWFTSLLLKKNKKGGLLLTSSTSCYQGVPYFANYSASKAYVLNLGEALNYELKSKGIHVTALVPGPTDTSAIDDMRDHMPMKPQPVNLLVEEGLKALLKNKPSYIGGSINRVMVTIMKTFASRKKATAFWGKMTAKMITS